MGITPMEINNKEFKRSFRGYDIDDVDDFLEQIVEDYEKLYKENTALREKITSLSEKLDHYTKIEATLQNTLILAQGAADQAKSNSQKEAELIIKNANDTAQKIIDQAHTEVVRITGEYEKIKQEFQLFKSRYKTFIQTQLDLLSDIDTVTNEPKSSLAGESIPKKQEYLAKLSETNIKLKEVSQFDDDMTIKIPDADIKKSIYQDNPNDFSSRSIDFRPKTLDFGSKSGDLSPNFDDFDDEDGVY